MTGESGSRLHSFRSPSVTRSRDQTDAFAGRWHRVARGRMVLQASTATTVTSSATTARQPEGLPMEGKRVGMGFPLTGKGEANSFPGALAKDW